MKLIIFAGGIGTRLWPLSRRNSPKQFDRIFNGQSTLELAISRVAPVFGIENIFIQTAEGFADLVREQIPELPEGNIITESERRNVGPAVCLAALELQQRGIDEPIAILWADHLVEKVGDFTDNLLLAERIIDKDQSRIIFLAERPRYAENNLGWMKVGDKIGDIDGTNYFSFGGWKYKPEPKECGQMFKDGDYFWNPGYFVTSVKFLIDRYKKYSPDIYQAVRGGNYIDAPKRSFDTAIIEQIPHSEAVIIKTNMGWSDPGTLYALKEALADSDEENVTRGQTYSLNSKDCLVYNTEEGKLITTVGLDGLIVVNTRDALIVVPKEKVREVTDLIKELEKEEKYKKYL